MLRREKEPCDEDFDSSDLVFFTGAAAGVEFFLLLISEMYGL